MPWGGPGDVEEYTILQTKPRPEEALLLLKRIHSLVKPIMKKHGWLIPKLCEFFPTNPNLLGMNVNRGQKILIRLRPSEDPHSFLDLEEMLIGTMLHELTHNVRGPHDAIFFKQLDALQDEYDVLRASGYEGEGFLGKGSRVGLGISHDKGMTKEEAKQKALKTIEEKARIARLLGKGGKVGGSVPDLKGKRLADVIADAAERRQKQTNSCGGAHTHNDPNSESKDDLPPEMQAEVNKAIRESKSYFVDLTNDSDEEIEVQILVEKENDNNNKVSGSKESIVGSSSSDIKVEEKSIKVNGKGKGKGKQIQELISNSSDSDIEIISPPPSKRSKPSTTNSKASLNTSKPPQSLSSSTSTSPSSKWICRTCTFENQNLKSLVCEVCDTRRVISGREGAQMGGRGGGGVRRALPSEPFVRQSPDGWICDDCFTMTSHDFWSCTGCGTVKQSSAAY